MGKGKPSTKKMKILYLNGGRAGFTKNKKPAPLKNKCKVGSSSTGDLDSDCSQSIVILSNGISGSSNKIKKGRKKISKNKQDINKLQQKNGQQKQKTKLYEQVQQTQTRPQGSSDRNKNTNTNKNGEANGRQGIGNGNDNNDNPNNFNIQRIIQQNENTSKKKKSRKSCIKTMSNFLRKQAKFFGFKPQIDRLQKDQQNEGKNYRGSTKFFPATLYQLRYNKPRRNQKKYKFRSIIHRYIQHLDDEIKKKEAIRVQLVTNLGVQTDAKLKAKIVIKIRNITNLINQYPTARSCALKFLDGKQLDCILQFFGENKEKTYLEHTIRYCLAWKKELQGIILPIQSEYDKMRLEELKDLMKSFQMLEDRQLFKVINDRFWSSTL